MFCCADEVDEVLAFKSGVVVALSPPITASSGELGLASDREAFRMATRIYTKQNGSSSSNICKALLE